MTEPCNSCALNHVTWLYWLTWSILCALLTPQRVYRTEAGYNNLTVYLVFSRYCQACRPYLLWRHHVLNPAPVLQTPWCNFCALDWKPFIYKYRVVAKIHLIESKIRNAVDQWFICPLNVHQIYVVKIAFDDLKPLRSPWLCTLKVFACLEATIKGRVQLEDSYDHRKDYDSDS